jgi:YMGG-like Gly-zipper
MRLSTTAARASLLLAIGLALGACSDRSKTDDALAQDTSLTRDLALANRDTASQPQLKDVPVQTEPAPVHVAPEPAPRPRAATRTVTRSRVAARQPAATKPQPTEPAPGRSVLSSSGNTVTAEAPGSERALGTVSVGSSMSFYSGQKVCTNTNAVGDRFTAQIAEPVQGSNGVVIPAGATAVVEITTLHRSQRSSDNIEIGLRVASITFNGKTYPVISEVSYAQVEKVRGESNTTGDAIKGAAIGAVLGQILGHRTKSTVIGAVGGAAAGAAIGAANAKVDGCVPSGGRITVKLTQPLVIQTG